MKVRRSFDRDPIPGHDESEKVEVELDEPDFKPLTKEEVQKLGDEKEEIDSSIDEDSENEMEVEEESEESEKSEKKLNHYIDVKFSEELIFHILNSIW